jgi:hypothetical protein
MTRNLLSLNAAIFFGVAICLCGAGSRPAFAQNTGSSAAEKPLPSAAELKERVLQNLQRSRAELERYVCDTVRETDLTDKAGNVKRRDVREYEMFFVNGQEIDTLKAKDGKVLDATAEKKEMERVQKKIEKDSNAQYVAQKDAEVEKQVNMLLHMLRYTNGRRVQSGGRAVLLYDLSGDPDVHPHGTEETFLHNMTGTIQVDEITGELVDLNARLDHDVKLAGGLLANLHKGFWIHVRQRRYPDGVWLPELVEGTGDARAALFFHPYFKFRDTVSGCTRSSVTMEESAGKVR